MDVEERDWLICKVVQSGECSLEIQQLITIHHSRPCVDESSLGRVCNLKLGPADELTIATSASIHITGFDSSLFGGRQKLGLGQHFIKEIGLAVRIRKTTVCRNVLNERVRERNWITMWQ